MTTPNTTTAPSETPAPATPEPAGQLTQPVAMTPATVLDTALGLLAGHTALKGFTLAIVAWPKDLPQSPAIASTAEGIETGTAMARCCELIGQSLQKQKPPEPKLVIATPSDTEALQKAAGKLRNPHLPKLRK